MIDIKICIAYILSIMRQYLIYEVMNSLLMIYRVIITIKYEERDKHVRIYSFI